MSYKSEDDKNRYQILLGDMFSAEYIERVKVKGYTEKRNIFELHSPLEMGKVICSVMPNKSLMDHDSLAKMHIERYKTLQKEWSELVEKASMETFGRKYQITDYKVSGIACNEYSEDHKKELRRLSHAATAHQILSLAHEAAAKQIKRNIKKGMSL